jgi:galactokinase
MGREGRLLLLDCRSQRIEHVPMIDPSVSVLIANSGVHRELAAGEFARRRARCEQAAGALGGEVLRDATLDGLEAVRDRCRTRRFVARGTW